MKSSLENIPFFDDLDKETLEILDPLFDHCTCHEGTVFEQGEPAIYLYLIKEGTVDITYKPYDSPPIAITTIKAGGIFGWSAIGGNTVYTSSALCLDTCSAIRIRGSELRELCIQNPTAGEQFLDRLAESVSNRWKNAHSQVRDILSQGVSNG